MVVGSSSAVPRPSALRNRGHQRAFSQGQISDNTASGPTRGHARVGSKTDFILPPGHKDSSEDSSSTSAAVLGGGSKGGLASGGGHSRQASRSESIYTLRRTAPPSLWQRILCFVLRRKPRFEQEERFRVVVPNHTVPPKTPRKEHPNGKRPDNRIRTTKYTLLSFLPRNLLEQFHRVANLYFIFIQLLNWFPAINAFGKEIAMLPVIFVLGVTAVKDLFEDRRRHASDKRINNSTCRIYHSDADRYKKVLWKEVRVGDLIHLSNNEVIPADILLLRTSDPNGLCYIDTGHLDGETNLKQRQVARGFVEKQDVFEPSKFKSRIEVDSPTTKIYRFHGTMVHPTLERVPVCTDNLLLRECLLKNTDYVEGIVVYTGHETKALLNNGGPRYKRSSLERQMNLDVIWCVIILIILCIIGAIGCKIFLGSYNSLQEPFKSANMTDSNEAFLAFWTYIIILQIMIPLSLYVTLEMCKIMQVYHIHNNADLYDPLMDKRVECRALNITEELGQIQYIFSDKTGTLTENRMIFRHCCINGVDYNHPELEEEGNTNLNVLVNPKMWDDLYLGRPTGEPFIYNMRHSHAAKIHEFLCCLAVCNTVVCANPHHDLMNASGIIESSYHASTNRQLAAEDSNSNTTITISSSSSSNSSSNTYPTLPLPLISSSPSINNNNNQSTTNTMVQQPSISDRYTRLEESRSVTPSPPTLQNVSPSPLLPSVNGDSTRLRLNVSTMLGQQGMRHIPTLTPITSVESSPIPSTASPQPRPITRLPPLPSLSPTVPTLEDDMSSPPSGRPSSILSRSPLRPPKMILQLPFMGGSRRAKEEKNGGGGTQGEGMISNTQSPGDLRPIFEAESPDELALVNAAYIYGCRLRKRTPSSVLLETPSCETNSLNFEIYHVLPFDSTRKCMSVIFRHPVTQKITMYCKGADSTILSRLAVVEGGDAEQMLSIEQTQDRLNSYARKGLRVLCMAKRIIGQVEYVEWLKKHREAELSAGDQQEKQMSESYARIESNLTLLGATGIEDRLQEGVPETLAALIAAGIVVWVLTGDKPETAINIAYSAKLFSPQMEVLKLFARSREAAERTISCYLEEIEKETPGLTSIRLCDPVPPVNGSKIRALVVDGKTMTFILDRRSNLVKPFLSLTRICTSVLCCRATPLQKAYIVKVVKEEMKMRTLAIGDGANDVSMIQTADVGIGISGQEGMQAVMAADYSLSRFKYLERFLLVHGHWSYYRLSSMVLYFFYKNAAFVFLTFWYQLYCGFSGAVMIDQMYLMLYNLLFTSLPPLAIGVYDQNASETLLRQQPSLYKLSRQGKIYRTQSFWFTMIDAVYQSIAIFFICKGTYDDSDIDIWEFGTNCTTACMFVMLLHAALETKCWTILQVGSLVISILAFYLYSVLYNSICVSCFGLPSNYWIIQHAMGSFTYWLIIPLACVSALLPRLLLRVYKATFRPDDITRATIAERVAQRRDPPITGLRLSLTL